MNYSSLSLIGTYAPRQCGIATFTQDLRNALIGACASLDVNVAAVCREHCCSHPSEVSHVIIEGERASYAHLADELNAAGVDAVSLQHEYGIFGGPDGAWILDTLRWLKMPVMTTCHTVLAEPSFGQKRVLSEIARLSTRMVVMTQHAGDLLVHVYGVPAAKIRVIPHGIPDLDPATLDREAIREELGWSKRKVLLSNGLVSPNKGLLFSLAAMPEIVKAHPDVLYVIAGATHPNLVRQEGEEYRETLVRLAETLGVSEHVQFINRFFTREELVGIIAASDVFVTPYVVESQSTSGVLAYASGLGKPVISTGFVHARELLDANSGILVPFLSPDAIAEAAIGLFDDPTRLQQMSATAYQNGRSNTWAITGMRYVDVLEGMSQRTWRPATPLPEHLPLHHLHQMTGPHGVYQHAKFDEPDLEHGTCTDDNARALILARDLLHAKHPDLMRLAELERSCFDFVCDAFNEDNMRFRNFRTADGLWLEDEGSEDSHGRALWALGHTARYATEPLMRYEATYLFHRALSEVERFTSPRAWAFTLLGLAKLPLSCQTPSDRATQARLASWLMQLWAQSASDGWFWFETIATYDNARLPQALLTTAAQIGDQRMKSVGLDTLSWLMKVQTTPENRFRPIGCKGFYRYGDRVPARWDQQPLEAQAALSACLEAYRQSGDKEWLKQAKRACAWFQGANDLAMPLGDARTGACCDGVSPHGLNHNCGAESTLAYLQALADMKRVTALASVRQVRRQEMAPLVS